MGGRAITTVGTQIRNFLYVEIIIGNLLKIIIL